MYRSNFSAGENENYELPKELVKENTIMDAIQQPSNSCIQNKIFKGVTKEIQATIEPNSIVHACDKAGVSIRGYQTLFRTVKDACKSKGLSNCFLPMPYQVYIY